MSIFAIGDTHLSLNSDKPMNIFKGWDDYVGRLSANWQAVVEPKDTVVVIGDVSWAMSLSEAQKDFAFLNELPGQKIILKGNHDYWWNTRRKMEDFFVENGFSTLHILHNNAFFVDGFSICGTRGWFYDDTQSEPEKVLLREVQRLKTSIDAGRALGGEPIVFLHYPPITLQQRCKPILDLLEQEKIERCFYAHLHGSAAYSSYRGEFQGTHFELLSGDFLKFCPKLIELTKS